MNRLQKRIASAVAASAVMLQLAVPALASTQIIISGNGAGSDNYGTVVESNTTTVTQSNEANVTNNVVAKSTTDDASANFNVGDVTVKSGDADTTVNVTNDLNTNVAHVDCCDASGNTEVEISGNGAKSTNTVALTEASVLATNQDNKANVLNHVYAKSDSGDLEADLNTNGDVMVKSGNATTDVTVSTHANTNIATVGTPLGGSTNPTASFIISGNGAFADNFINATLAKTNVSDQDNLANITNAVHAKSKCGDLGAEFNTGGDTTVWSGDATTTANVTNDVNFNYAALNCGCAEWDVMAKIHGNGAEGGYGHHHWWDTADNVINLTLANTKAYGQDNLANLNNDLGWLYADTGDLDSDLNTGESGTDP